MSIANLPTATEWYTTLAALDSFYLAIWLIVALLIPMYLFLDHVFQFKFIELNLNWLNHRFFWHILWIVALLLRIPRFFTPFWYDETFTGVMARLPLDKFVIALKGDVHPPLHYLIAMASRFLLGDSDFALRFPSLIAGLALIYVVYRLAFNLIQDEQVARLTSLLMAVLPTMIHYSAEARYPMMLALAVCGAWLAILEDDSAWFVLSAVSTVLLHATGIIYAFVLMIIVIFKRRMSLEWLVSQFMVLLVMVIYVGFVLFQSRDVGNGFWLWAMLPSWHIVEGLVMMPSADLMIPVYAGVVILFIAGSLAMIRLNNRTRAIWIALAIFPPVSLFVLGLLWHPVYLPRALIASAIIPVIGWGYLAVHSKRKALYQWLIIFTVILAGFSYFQQMIRQWDDTTFDKAFAMCDGTDIIYTTSTNMSIASLYYYPERSISFVGGNNQHQELSLEARQAIGFDFISPELLNKSICVVVNWNYYTTQEEIERIASLKRYYHFTTDKIISLDAFGFYEVMRTDD